MSKNEDHPLDLAARAGWLYYTGGHTQDQIAAELGVSRQRAQRLVARAVAEGLVRVRLDHRISALIDLERRLIDRFQLADCRVAPSLGAGTAPNLAIASPAAEFLEKVLEQEEPQIIAVGTGRAIRAMADEVFSGSSPQHQIASLVGNIGLDGSATLYDVVLRIAEKRGMRPFPMPVPVITSTAEEREAFHALAPVRSVLAKVAAAGAVFVGVGQMGPDAPLLVDGFLSREELDSVSHLDATGEIAGHIFDSQGNYIESPFYQRVAGLRVRAEQGRLVTGIAAGPAKISALCAALKGRLLNALITDEETAIALLA